LIPKELPAVPIVFCNGDELIQMLHKLRDPSVIAVVSVSQYILRVAQGFLAPAIARRHTLTTYLFPFEDPKALNGADVIICDSIAMREVKGPKRFHYRLSAPASIQYLSSAMQSYQEVKHPKPEGKAR
jgi:hypothetical protein